MKKVRLISLCLILVLLISSFAGCSKTSTTTQQPITEPETEKQIITLTTSNFENYFNITFTEKEIENSFSESESECTAEISPKTPLSCTNVSITFEANDDDYKPSNFSISIDARGYGEKTMNVSNTFLFGGSGQVYFRWGETNLGKNTHRIYKVTGTIRLE